MISTQRVFLRQSINFLVVSWNLLPRPNTYNLTDQQLVGLYSRLIMEADEDEITRATNYSNQYVLEWVERGSVEV